MKKWLILIPLLLTGCSMGPDGSVTKTYLFPESPEVTTTNTETVETKTEEKAATNNANPFFKPKGTEEETTQPESKEAEPEEKTVTPTELLIVSIDIPNYLNGPGIVSRLKDNEIIVARNNLWIDDLDTLLITRIEEDLAKKQTHYVLGSSLKSEEYSQLNITIDRFNATNQGTSEIRGKWTLIDSNHQAVATQKFDIATPLALNGYGALVMAFGEGITQLTDEIATKL